MATYGIEVLTGLSETRLDGNSKTIRTVYWTTLQGGSSGSISIPQYSAHKGVISFHAINGYNSEGQSGDTEVNWDESSKTLSWNLQTIDQAEPRDIIVSMVHYE